MDTDPRLNFTGSHEFDDQALMARVERGDQEALITLHRRYVNLVYSLALRIVGETMLAEEITQDVFVKLWLKPHTYDAGRGRFSSWLLTVTRYAAIDCLRRESRRLSGGASLDEDEESAGVETTPDRVGTPREGEEYQHLRLVLQQIPVEQRQVIELAYYGGMSQHDIAEYLHQPLGTVKTRMRLGLQKLRALWRA